MGRVIRSGGWASGGEGAQVGPAVTAMEPAGIVQQSFGAEVFEECARRVPSVREEKHRIDAHLEESVNHTSQKKAAEASALERFEQVELAQLAAEFRESRVVVANALRKAGEVAVRILNDETEPAAIIVRERTPPL